MSHPEGAETNIDFKWGKKGCGGKNQGVQFYDSFTYDGVEYSLYDCVYLYTEDHPFPYIGKLVKIWEKANVKKVKVIWFFRPSELVGDLICHPIHKNEIFLAAGEGQGVANVNHLEVINGKCNVVCTMKDERNPQPSVEELITADYIFSHVFDVEKNQLSEEIKGVISGIDAKHFFNRKSSQQLASGSNLQANLIGRHTISGLSRLSSAKAVDNEAKAKTASSIDGYGEVKRMPDRGTGRTSLSYQKVTSWLKYGLEEDVKAERVSTGGGESKVGLNSVKDSKKHELSCDLLSDEYCGPVCSTKPLKNPDAAHLVHEKKNNVKIGSDNKGKLYESDIRSTEDKRKATEDIYGENRKKISRGAQWADQDGRELTQGKDIGTDSQGLEVTPKLIDKSNWFTNYSWEERLEDAYEQHSVALFENLDPSCTSKEVQDIIWEAFQLKCTAKVLPRSTLSSPHSGQALAIFKLKRQVQDVIDKSQKECCVLEKRRILAVSHPEVPRKSKEAAGATKFPGHLSLEKMSKKHGGGAAQRMAVSTSHVAQRNTVEYDMAVEWIQLQQVSDLQWKQLHEQQKKEMDCLWNRLKQD
ncbi:hypothetical protein ACHQM5_020665 [Ranunculus cassubicifolius]